jgi:hypothetical protein
MAQRGKSLPLRPKYQTFMGLPLVMHNIKYKVAGTAAPDAIRQERCEEPVFEASGLVILRGRLLHSRLQIWACQKETAQEGLDRSRIHSMMIFKRGPLIPRSVPARATAGDGSNGKGADRKGG